MVAKTGTVIPGVGTIASLDKIGSGLPVSYVDLNNRGQVAFAAVLGNGQIALLLATPEPGGGSAAVLPKSISPSDNLVPQTTLAARVEPALVGTPVLESFLSGQETGGKSLVPQTQTAGAGSVHTRALDRLFAEVGHFAPDDALSASLAFS